MSFNNEKGDALAPMASNHVGEVNDAPAFAIHDEVFGDVGPDGPNYRNVGWLGTSALMMKTQIGLGVLSIPAVLDTLGLIPGLICLWVIAGITTWSDYMVGAFKIRHPNVYNIDDVGALMAGRIGRELFGLAFGLYWLFLSGAGMLGVSTALNALSLHGACTAIFVAVAAIGGCMLASIQTLGRISWLAWVGLSGIVLAIITLTISVGVQDRPASAPQTGPWKSDYKIIGNPSLTDALAACSSLVFAYAGTPGFFSIVSEMRDPRHYNKALIVCQTVVTVLYTVIGIVVYYYCGSYVASPALGSAGVLLKRICYGLALPGLLVSTTLFIHLASKYFFIRILRGTKHLASNTKRHWTAWFGCTIGSALIGYIIASAIPVFGELISLIGALFATLLSFQPYGFMWLYDNWKLPKSERSSKWTMMVVWCCFIIVSGTFLMVAGTYSSIVSIIHATKGGVFSCADNSNFS